MKLNEELHTAGRRASFRKETETTKADSIPVYSVANGGTDEFLSKALHH